MGFLYRKLINITCLINIRYIGFQFVTNTAFKLITLYHYTWSHIFNKCCITSLDMYPCDVYNKKKHLFHKNTKVIKFYKLFLNYFSIRALVVINVLSNGCVYRITKTKTLSLSRCQHLIIAVIYTFFSPKRETSHFRISYRIS